MNQISAAVLEEQNADPLAPSRGILLGLVISMTFFWLPLAVAIWMGFHHV